MSPDHWLELFRLLKMPRGTILEKLTFGDVMESADQIIVHADALKVRFLDGMLVHRRSFPRNLLAFPNNFANTVSPVRARNWTARSGDERTNHEATAPTTRWLG